MNGYDDDWAEPIRECWQLHSLQPSQSLTDLIAQAIQSEHRRAEYTLFRVMRFDMVRKLRLGLSKKPKMFKDLITFQVSQLIADIGDEQAPNPFSIGFDRGKQIKTAGFDLAMPVEIDTEGVNNQVAMQRLTRKSEIA